MSAEQYTEMDKARKDEIEEANKAELGYANAENGMNEFRTCSAKAPTFG